MASGKQLSFQYGEVAPELHYKSDAVSYANGVSKLKNMYVIKTGGVSNRPGTFTSGISNYQDFVPLKNQGIRVKSFQSSFGRIDVVALNVGNRIYLNGIEITAVKYNNVSTTAVINAPAPSTVNFTETKDGVFIAPGCTFTGVVPSIPDANIFIDSTGAAQLVAKYPALNATVSATYTANGMAPWLPVSYYVTATLFDGTEIKLDGAQTAGYNPSTWNANAASIPNTLLHPHASLSTTLKYTFTTPSQLSNVKNFNFYRAATANGGTVNAVTDAYYKLVGRVPYTQGQTVVSFVDYGADDASRTPPIDVSMFPASSTQFNGASFSTYYQQRLITYFGQYSRPPGIKKGDILVSKIGAPKQMAAPIIYSDTDSFVFNVPVTDGSDVRGFLPLQRLVVLTDRGVYVIRGGEQGILTPTMINPANISTEGCSSVEPKMAGRRGYFLNAGQTKLMKIEFGADDNVDLVEASIFSSHLLRKNPVVQIEVMGGSEDVVYLLRRNGDLTRITIGPDGEAHGFSEYTIANGFIESLFRVSQYPLYNPDAKPSIDTIRMYVIRNGTRFEETLSIRDDSSRKGEIFTDSTVRFGYRLARDLYSSAYVWDEGYTPLTLTLGTKLNIHSTTGSWTAGTPLQLQSNFSLLPQTETFVIHFFYDDAEGNENFIRFTLGAQTNVGGAYPYRIAATADVDVPESLRDVLLQSDLSDDEKLARMTRWTPAINRIYNTPGPGPLPVLMLAAGSSTNPENVNVAIVADGEIISSPLNPNKPTLQLQYTDSGDYLIELGDYYGYGYVGIPYMSEFETMDIEAEDNRTLTDAHKLINAVGVAFYETRGGYYGMPGKDIQEMEELVWREDESFSVQTPNVNGYITVHIPAEWNKSGRVNIKQVDPAPMTILSVYPKGLSSGE